MIARQSAELEELRTLVNSKTNEKELQLEAREKELEKLMQKLQQQQDEDQTNWQEQLKAKDQQLEELQTKWKQEQGVKPALEQVTDQLNDLKKAVSTSLFNPPLQGALNTHTPPVSLE